MLEGSYLIHGRVIEHPRASPWAHRELAQDPGLQGFGWLDDLAAVDTPAARRAAQDWLFDWIARHGRGAGAGWAPDVTGRRLVRWVHHAILILSARPPEDSRAFFRSLGQQARFLARRWHSVPAGLPRFEALTGLVYAGLALEGLEHLLSPALSALGRECAREIAPDGGLPDRNPEALAEVLTLLAWVNMAVSHSGGDLDPRILRAMDRLAPAIRALRLGDGRLVRFHGSAGGQADRIDRALSDAGVRSPAYAGGAMGFARMAAGGTLVVADAAPLPAARHAERSHASTLAFEMSSGRVPVLVNMGPAARFDARTRRAARATAAHNALAVDRLSSASFIADGLVGRVFGQRLIAGPRRVTLARDSNRHGLAVLGSHDGFRAELGLVHERQLALVHSGRSLQGRERLYCAGPADREKLAHALQASRRDHLEMQVHFHAHPAVSVTLDMGDRVAGFHLPGGESWLLRAEAGRLTLAGAEFLDPGRLRPRATKQVVVTLPVSDYEACLDWTFTRAD